MPIERDLPDLPEVGFGAPPIEPGDDDPPEAGDDDQDDDEELSETPPDLVELLGFDPLEVDEEDSPPR